MRNFVLCEPEIRVTNLNRMTDDFILLASDGLYDRFSSAECIELGRRKFIEEEMLEQDPTDVASHLVLEAVKARVNSDNTTAICVGLNAGIDLGLERNASLEQHTV
jgi:serine/threonine protein phosphatase PrpC